MSSVSVEMHTRSARESSSWPISDDFFRHLATFPSMKSKKRPNGMKPRAIQMFPCWWDSPRQYLSDENIDITRDFLVSFKYSYMLLRHSPGDQDR